MDSVELLILGAGWTSQFLIPLCKSEGVTYAATSTSNKPDTLQFTFDPSSDDPKPFVNLPKAHTIVITFPIRVAGGSKRLVSLYKQTHPTTPSPHFIQLGSTGIWDGVAQGGTKTSHVWIDRHSAFNMNDRGAAEEELLRLSPDTALTAVIDLAGLWGGQRSPRNWVRRVAATKDALRDKGSIHMIHGIDVSRALLAVHRHFDRAAGQRWILTDGRVYDWWDLASAWGESGQKGGGGGLEGPQPAWVKELMDEAGIRALPRDIALLGRGLDSREFWLTFGISPWRARLEETGLDN